MKNQKVLIVILIFAFLQTNYAQQLAQDGNQWNITYGAVTSPAITTTTLLIDGDTLINNISYKKVYRTQDSLNTNWTLSGDYLREDMQRVYLKNWLEEDETLLYDFSLVVGDTMRYNALDLENCYVVVSEIDSVVLNNGESRKRLKVIGSSNPEGDYWIEGVGSLKGLTDHFLYHCVFDYQDELLCHYDDGVLLYPENPTTCFISTTPVREITLNDEIDIFPNPVRDILIVKDKSGQNRVNQILLYNSVGMIVQRSLVNETSTELSLAQIPTGIYFLQLEIKNGDVFTKRLIKH